MKKAERIESFDLPAGFVIGKKYSVITKLGEGWEGEVYKICEMRTGIERAAKVFYPERNPGHRTSIRYAKKLHKLRHCPLMIQYHTEEVFPYKDTAVTALISEYVEGRIFSGFLKQHPGGRLTLFEAINVLYILVKGVEHIHQKNEYHGDLHPDNIIINRRGPTFDIKVMDFYHWKDTKSENKKSDIIDLVRLFYESLGGARHYSKHPNSIKHICCGLKHSLILNRFKSCSSLRKHLETLVW